MSKTPKCHKKTEARELGNFQKIQVEKKGEKSQRWRSMIANTI